MTAYDLRMCDCSSDVCSSDLPFLRVGPHIRPEEAIIITMVVVARQYIGANLRRIADQEEAAFVATRWHRSLNQFSDAHILIWHQRSQVLACVCFSVGRAGRGIAAQPIGRLRLEGRRLGKELENT